MVVTISLKVATGHKGTVDAHPALRGTTKANRDFCTYLLDFDILISFWGYTTISVFSSTTELCLEHLSRILLQYSSPIFLPMVTVLHYVRYDGNTAV